MLRLASIFGVTSVLGQSDGNPHKWDRQRRCDHVDYSPPCGPCEGAGGKAWADKANKFTPVPCTVDGVYDADSRVRPVWGADFTERKSHEILIGLKQDPACFAAFPANDSVGTHCYKPQECQLYNEMNHYKAFVLVANQGGNAWGVTGNVSSTIYHQNTNMWIVNTLLRTKLVNQCICTIPREGGDPSKPGVGPIQYNWVDKLFYVATETLDVEYGVGSQLLDHWAFGPHHAWTDPATGLIVRMWQPFNGLQVFGPGAFSKNDAYADAVHKGYHLFDQLSTKGDKAPDWCVKKGSPINTIQINCDDNGFYDTSKDESAHWSESPPAGTDKAAASDLRRARTKVPRDEYKGDGFESMAQTLNKYLVKHAPNSRHCDSWTVQELQELQFQLLMLRDTQLDDVYHETDDNRKIAKDIKAMSAEWEELNELASTDPDLQRAHRDGHCHEAVMWYVHHLPEDMKTALKDDIALPLLSFMKHDLKESAQHGKRVHTAYAEKVTCQSCHAADYPAVVTI